MKDFESLLRHEVLWIAEELIKASEENEHGIYWKTLHRQPYGELYEQVNEEIYNGVSGISLFFISAYKYYNDKRYIEIAEKSMLWCLHYIKTHPQRHYTFYTGIVGVIYLKVKLFEATGDHSQLNSATALLKKIEEGIVNKVNLDDFLSGNAGNLFVITSLYVHTNDSHQYKLIKLLINKIISNARISKNGLKWGYLNNALDSCIGMSHGACGIAHVLMEVAKSLDYPELNWLAEKAIAFEDQYFSKSTSSWIDMRIEQEHKVNEDIIKQGLSFYLKSSKGVNAWAHGTTGLGLVRLNAYNLLKKSIYKKSSEAAIAITVSDMDKEITARNMTISTGMGAWAELCLTASNILRKPKLKDQAEIFIQKAISLKSTSGFYGSGWYADKADPALLVGTAGIGLLYLQVLDHDTESILLPKLRYKMKQPIIGRLPLQSIKEAIYGKYLRRTSWMLSKHISNLDDVYNDDGKGININTVCKKIKALIKKLPEKQRPVVMDAFKLEVQGIRLSIIPDYNIYREQKYDFFKRQAIELQTWSSSEFDKIKFKRSKHIKLIANKWPWPLDDKVQCLNNNNLKVGYNPVILRLEIDQVIEFRPNKFSFELLKLLEKPLGLTDLIAIFKESLDIEEEYLRNILIKKLRYFAAQWFVESKQNERVIL